MLKSDKPMTENAKDSLKEMSQKHVPHSIINRRHNNQEALHAKLFSIVLDEKLIGDAQLQKIVDGAGICK